MKKLVALFLAACMTFSLAACGSGSSENTPAGTKAAEAGTETNAQPADNSGKTLVVDIWDNNQLDGLQKIADEAVKQCKRGKIPEISDPVNFNEMIKELKAEGFDMIILPFENEEGYTMKDALRNGVEEAGLHKGSRIAVIIGPEGGFEEEEVKTVVDTFDRKAAVVSLGKTILRTETAGMAALAMIMYELEL